MINGIFKLLAKVEKTIVYTMVRDYKIPYENAYRIVFDYDFKSLVFESEDYLGMLNFIGHYSIDRWVKNILMFEMDMILLEMNMGKYCCKSVCDKYVKVNTREY